MAPPATRRKVPSASTARETWRYSRPARPSARVQPHSAWAAPRKTALRAISVSLSSLVSSRLPAHPPLPPPAEDSSAADEIAEKIVKTVMSAAHEYIASTNGMA
eukprot:scaffold158724_cov41-Tisochrysis_lutea.AAC.1